MNEFISLWFNGLFNQFNRYYKMFPSITDSVMDSHIFFIDVFFASAIFSWILRVNEGMFVWLMAFSINLTANIIRCFLASQIL